MLYDFPLMDAVLYGDTAMPKISEILYCRRAFDVDTYGKIPFIEGCYTSLKFPQEAVNRERRQAQRMNYEYCVQTIAGLMKKYAPEILNRQEDGYGNG